MLACAGLAFAAVFLCSLLAGIVGQNFTRQVYSYIPAVPLVSALLMAARRDEIFRGAPEIQPGLTLLLTGLAVAGLSYFTATTRTVDLGLRATGFILLLAGALTAKYGRQAGRNAIFPLGFLILMVPPPEALLGGAVLSLQKGTAIASEWLFRMLGIPVFRNGLFMSIPGLNIEVDPQCSGIRSSFVLLITAVVLGQLFLASPWRRLCLLVAVLPVAILKNAIRVVSLSVLGAYVDRGFLTGYLHQSGGILFFVLALMMLAPLFLLLVKLDHTGQQTRQWRQVET